MQRDTYVTNLRPLRSVRSTKDRQEKAGRSRQLELVRLGRRPPMWDDARLGVLRQKLELI